MVRLTDRLDMTLDVYCERKTTIQPTLYYEKNYFSFPEMSFTLTSLNEALAMEPNSECSVALKVIEIGDTITYKNQQGQERSYYVMKVADEVQVTAIRNYQVRSKTLVNAGKTYAFLNIIRKVGDESFWTTKNTNIIGWVSLNVPDNVMNQTVSTTPENSPRKLNQAIQSGSTSLVKGKIVQVLFHISCRLHIDILVKHFISAHL